MLEVPPTAPAAPVNLGPLAVNQDVSVMAFRVKILEQFVETVNKMKGQRHQTAQTHVCAALCSLLKVPQHRRLPTSVSVNENGIDFFTFVQGFNRGHISFRRIK